VTVGGVLLPGSAKEKPIGGEVVSVGPGKREKDGTRKTPQVNTPILYGHDVVDKVCDRFHRTPLHGEHPPSPQLFSLSVAVWGLTCLIYFLLKA